MGNVVLLHHERFHGGRSAWFFKTPSPEDYKSPVGDWLEHRQDLAKRANVKRVRERELTRRNRTYCPASLKVVKRYPEPHDHVGVYNRSPCAH